MPTENNEKVTGPHSGWFGITSVLLLTLATWGFLFFLHVTYWRDPINPLTRNERSTVIQPAAEATTPAPATGPATAPPNATPTGAPVTPPNTPH